MVINPLLSKVDLIGPFSGAVEDLIDLYPFSPAYFITFLIAAAAYPFSILFPAHVEIYHNFIEIPVYGLYGYFIF